jgi:hypothetical protein
MAKKDFPTLAVLSITSGRLLTQPRRAKNGFDQIYEVLEWMTDDQPPRINWGNLQ